MSHAVAPAATEKRRVEDTIEHQYDLQTKALSRWERQQQAWDRMQENLRRHVGPQGGSNMSRGVYITRGRAEDLTVIAHTAPSILFNGPHAWPSSLRSDGKDGAVRYVKVGRTDYPYALYGKVSDHWRLNTENNDATRVVFAGQQDSAPEFTRRADGYYAQQRDRASALVKPNMVHLNLPRAYLQLCGAPPPVTSSQREANAAERDGPPVEYFPPPAPTKEEEEAQEESLEHAGSEKTSNLRASRGVTTVRSTAGFTTRTGSGTESMLATTAGGLTEGPFLEISTTRLLFFARPGELVHGTTVVRNRGTTTVYYSWNPLEPNIALYKGSTSVSTPTEMEETSPTAETTRNTAADVADTADNTLEKGEEEEEGEEEEVEEVEEKAEKEKEIENDKDVTMAAIGERLHSLAKHTAQSRRVFCLSAPLDGVILPDEEASFAFSARSPCAGRFTQCYELLMIPVVPRVVVELCAIVCDAEPSLGAMARPIAAALDANATADAQRHTLHRIVANDNLYEASAIRAEIEMHHRVARHATEASAARLARWHADWDAANRTALGLPFNRHVYARMAALYNNLAAAMSALGHPLHHPTWDGSVLTLQAQLCRLRDAPSRNTFREGLRFLLLAARVCAEPEEPMDVLLRRLAGAAALRELARRAGDMADAAGAAVGLQTPLSPRPPPPPAPTARKHVPPRGGKGAGKGRAADGGGRAFFPEELTDSASATDGPGDAAAREEFRARLFTGMWRLVGDAVDRMCATYDSARYTMEAACFMPLLEITQSMREAEVRAVQSAEDMDVDHTVDVIPQKKKK